MTKTLHAYYFRELSKTFLLTTISLTLLVTMGGGVANVFRNQGVDAIRILKILVLLVPIAVTLVMPIAALFSSTITYGRSSADNEINACRAAGINVHKLLASALFLSVAVSAFSYFSWNYFIPGLTARIYDYGRQDLTAMLLSNLRRNRGVTFRNYVLYADDSMELTREQLPANVNADRHFIMLRSAAFLEMADVLPLRCGTTDTAVIEFDTASDRPDVRIDLQGVRTFDIGRGQYLEMEHQMMGPYPIPLPVGTKLRFQDLPTLRSFAAAPYTIPELNERIWGLRVRLLRVFTYQSAMKSFDPAQGGNGIWHLDGAGESYDIQAKQYATSEDEGQPSLRGVTVAERNKNGTRKIKADAGIVRLRETFDRAKPLVQVELSGDVEIRGGKEGDRVIKLPSEKLEPVPVPPDARARFDALRDGDLFDPRVNLAVPAKLTKIREKLCDDEKRFICAIDSTIHFRNAYSLSTVAVVVMGAILGVVLRGGQVLTAFGISCIPSLVVVVGTILGRNLAEHPQTALAGLGVMWLADVILAAATVWIALRFMRR